MTLAWADVIDGLVRVVETWSGRRELQRIAVVRDLRGRVRIAVRPAPGATPDAEGLSHAIAADLGGWFAPPILWTQAPSSLEERRLAHNVLESSLGKWPLGWPTNFLDTLGTAQPISTGAEGTWSGDVRLRTKDSWLHAGTVTLPWPLHPRTPTIVSFYSFKGGVGRTTTLGVIARQLARLGRHVVALDLDLEAPGLGRFFDIEAERGVLDLLSEHSATGRVDLAETATYSATIDEGDGQITVYPVGTMDASYVERLACLDYAPRARTDQSAVEQGLRALLREIKARHSPDYIFLDARAGLHDLGGLSLHALAHVDVLVGRAGAATLDGFRLVLAALSRRRRDEDLRVIMAQTFVPLPVDGEAYTQSRDAWAVSLHEVFAETLYSRMYSDQGVDLPEVRDGAAWHFPWAIPQYDSLGPADRIQDIDQTVLDAEPFARLRMRILERAGDGAFGDDEDDEDGT